MKRVRQRARAWLAAWAGCVAGVTGAAAAPAFDAEAERPALLLVGDSTLAPRTGYGNALCARVAPPLACLNLARGGRSTLSYRAEGLWDEVLARLRAGAPGVQQHVLIQFGHNDQPGKPGRSTDLATEFPTNLGRYVDEVRAAGGVPLLATPLTRRSFRGDQLNNDLAAWAEATRRVAANKGVPLLDLNRISAAAVQALGQAGADELAMAPPPPAGASGKTDFDRTHLGPKGACLFAQQMAEELARQVPALAGALRPGPDCAALPPPAAPATVQGLPTAADPPSPPSG